MIFEIKKLELKNFKSIASKVIEFSAVTEIYGDNGVGKTTIFDAFCWLLFNKNSLGDGKFEIKTTDESGNVIDKLEHYVEAIIEIDGEEITLRKTHVQKWVKKRGSEFEVLDGSTNSYLWNNVPCKTEKEFLQRLSEKIDISLLPILSDTKYFTSLKWEEQRKILFSIVEIPTDDEIVSGDEKYTSLAEILATKSIEDYKKELNAKIKLLVKAGESHEARIDEVFKGIEAVESFDDEEISREKEKLEKLQTLKNNKLEIFNNKFEKQEETLKKINTLESEKTKTLRTALNGFNTLQDEAKNLIESLKARINNFNKSIKNLEESTAYNETLKVTKQAELDKLRELSKAEKAKIFHFDDDLCICPTCKQSLPVDEIEEQKKTLSENFNLNKIKVANEIKKKGLKVKNELEIEIDKNIKANGEEIEKLKAEILKLQLKIKKHQEELLAEYIKPDFTETEDEIANLKLTLEDVEDVDVSEEIQEKEKELLAIISDYKKSLIIDGENKKKEKRIEQLKEEYKENCILIAQLEKQIFLVENFSSDKVKLLEEKVNELFELVRFKLFHTQVNEGVIECCRATVNGIEINNGLNHGILPNVGIDIINVLSRFYGVNMPIFCDDAESTTKFLYTDSQLIKLIVSKDDKEIRIKKID